MSGKRLILPRQERGSLLSKVCRKCGINKNIDEYHWRDDCQNYRHECKQCRTDAAKDNLLMVFYKMTREEYNYLLKQQGDVCGICKSPKYEYRNLAVDHDHHCCPGEKSCGQCVRGILCSNCNCGLGSLKENKNLLRSAINYLENHLGFKPSKRKIPIKTNDISLRSWVNDLYADYKLNTDEYYYLLNIQQNVCAICFNNPIGKKYLSVDHDHDTQLIRGLLCMPCNSSLGYFKDNTDVIYNAITYLNNPFKGPDGPARKS
jgi:hypothetical protein